MGGSLSGGNMTPAAEFNMYVDPVAASIVFGSGVPLTMVGLDVTRQCVLTEKHVRDLQEGGSAICKAAKRIAASSPGRAMHDPLAVAGFIDRSLLRLKKYYVAIETRGELTAGETVGYAGPSVRRSAPRHGSPQNPDLREASLPNANVAVDVDATRFFDIFIGRLSGRPNT